MLNKKLIVWLIFLLISPQTFSFGSLINVGNESKKYLLNDFGYQHQWYLQDSSPNGIQFEKTWVAFQAHTREEVKVAVIDTGADVSHADLKKNLWINTGEIPHNGIDDDGNGYIDDIYGISTLDRDADGKATNHIETTDYHGTHVAGIIAASQNNEIGISGIARRAKTMIIKAIPESDEDERDVAEALLYAAQNGAKIINCSFGKKKFYNLLILKSALEKIEKEFDVLIVVASGNGYLENLDINPNYPAAFSFSNLITVASHDSFGDMSKFTNFGFKTVHLSAPGNFIYSTVPGQSYEAHQGTSMSAPIVSGIAAEIRSNFPNLKASQVKQILIETADPLPSFKNKTVSGGKVNMYKAMVRASQM